MPLYPEVSVVRPYPDVAAEGLSDGTWIRPASLDEPPDSAEPGALPFRGPGLLARAGPFALVAVLARAVLTESITESSTIDSGVEIRCYIVEGRAGQALVDAAEGAGLLVVGCRGHGDLTETMLGSVAQFCSHYALCPVVIMRGRH
jgi:nucleotide-binding universal stress UspA family protein